MIKVLFLIHDLGQGGAEKVLVNLVNNMDKSKFDISVTALFGGGANEKNLAPHINYRTILGKTFPGNSHLMKLLTPQQLYRWLIPDKYDIVVSYLEGPSARIVGGCPQDGTKVVSWIHCTMKTEKDVAKSFRSVSEAKSCYKRADMLSFVSEQVRQSFFKCCPIECESRVLYNTNESSVILDKSAESVECELIDRKEFNWCGVGKLVKNKGFDRMLRIQKRLAEEGYNIHFFALGEGEQRDELTDMCDDYGIADSVTFLGYQINPYKYVSKCDLFVCASHAEGFSTAATEALIVGTPVCTVEVSGMREMLGENNEYGIVTENSEEALYRGIKYLIDDSSLLEHYKQKAVERGKMFSTENTVYAVEKMLIQLNEETL